MIMILLIHLTLALCLVLIMNFLGNISKETFGYQNTSSMTRTTNFNYNFLLRALTPAIFICLVSIAAFAVDHPAITKNIWLVPVYYCVINLIILIVLNRFRLANKPALVIVYLISVSLSYGVYSLAIDKGMEFLLPEASNFRTEIWFIILLYFYKLLNNFGPDPLAEERRKNLYYATRYKKLVKQYKGYLSPKLLNDDVVSRTFFSIMIYEDMNRPKSIRLIERVLSVFGFARTTGIMQVWSKEVLTDEASIKLAETRILKVAADLRAQNINYEYEIVNRIAQDYNGSQYAQNIIEIYSGIKNWMGRDRFGYKEL